MSVPPTGAAEDDPGQSLNQDADASPRAQTASVWSILLRLGIAGALVTYLFRSGAIEVSALLGLVAEWPITLGAFGLLFINSIVVALRLPVLLRTLGFELGAFAAIRLAYIGMFFNVFLPGGAGGDAVKIYYTISAHRGSRAELATVVLFDRVLAMIVLLAWPLIFSPFFIDVIESSRKLQAVLAVDIGLTTVSIGGLAVVLGAPESWLARIRALVARLPFGGLAVRTINTVRAFRAHPSALASAIGISVVGHALGVGAALWLSNAVGDGFAAPMLLLCPIGFLVNTIPITPGGLGVGEVAFDQLFGLVGLEGGAEMILAWRILVAVVALGGLIFYLDGRRRFVEAPAAQGSRS